MIYDKIDNLETYSCLSKNIQIGLEYIRMIKPNVEKGVHELSPYIKAIISEYNTTEENENGYEAHRDYIDIQYLIRGTEKVCCLPLEYPKETKKYKAETDAAFYKENGVMPQELLLGNGYFAIFFPQDGHKPCLSVKESIGVKKVVIKVKI